MNKKTEDPEQIAQAFQDALESEDTEKITQTYAALSKVLRGDPELDAAALVQPDTISSGIELLSKTSYINDDFSTLYRMFHDLRQIWRIDAQSDANNSAYLKALVSSGRLRAAGKHLANSSEGRAYWEPTTADWALYLRGYLAVQNTERPYAEAKQWMMQNVPADKQGPQLCALLAESLFRTHEDVQIPQEVKWLLGSTATVQATFTEEMEVRAALLSGYLDHRDPQKATEIARDLRDRIRSAGSSYPPVAAAMHALARYEASFGDSALALEMFQELAQSHEDHLPHVLADVTKDALARTDLTFPLSLANVQDALARTEKLTGLLPSYKSYEMAMRQVQGFDEAVRLYRDAYRDGVPVSSAMLRAMLSKATPGSQADTTDVLKTLYADLAQSRLTESKLQDGLHSTALYIRLLQYCARDDVRDLTWATTLMEDMKANGLSLLNTDEVILATHNATVDQDLGVTASTSACSLVTSLMQHACDDHSQAFKAYSWMWAIDQQNIFSRKDWYTIVRTYTDLDFSASSKQSYVPASIFYAFFEDMRKVGHPPDSLIYQAVLHYYAREGTSQKSNAEAVSHIHDLIKMDHYYDPDIGLMNRLMYAYGKTGDLDHALGVWRSILINRIPFNNVTISIVLDNYGYKEAYEKIVKLWSNLSKQGFAVNRKNFESYLEALCRCGHVPEAAEELFELLRKGQMDMVGAHTVLILLRFSRWDSDTYHELRKRIENEAPRYWPEVKAFGQSLNAIHVKQRNTEPSKQVSEVDSSTKANAAVDISQDLLLDKP